jgi:hypothetical protein
MTTQETNVWGTKVGGIEVAVQETLAQFEPMSGGVLVAQVITVNGTVYNARDGWVLELCQESSGMYVYIRLLGTTVHRKVEADLFEHDGEERTTADEHQLALLTSREYAVEQYRRANSEVDAAFARISVAS